MTYPAAEFIAGPAGATGDRPSSPRSRGSDGGPVNFDSYRLSPAGGNTPSPTHTAMISAAGWSSAGACMQFELITADGRLFDLDVWDWSMMVGGSLLVGLVALLG
jgi:hypothetical protein